MAGDWIKMTVALSTSPKVVRISSACNADECPPRVRVVGALHAVWCLFDQHSTDGKLRGYTLQMIDEVLGWPGFAKAMADAEWIKETPQGIEMPEFETHNGAPAKRRAQEAERKRNVRKSSAPNADKKRTREEKRREERTTPISPSRKAAPLPDGWEPAAKTVENLSREFGLRVPEDVARYIAAFRDICSAKGYVYKDFDAAFRNCVRQDWPKIRANGWKPALTAESRQDKCECGAPGTMKIGSRWRCQAHARAAA